MSKHEVGGDSVPPESDDPTFVTARPSSLVDRLLNWIGVSLFIALLLLGTAQVIIRFITAPYLGYNISWTAEASRFVLIYSTMVGSIIAARDAEHIQIEVIVKRLPRQARRAVKLFTRILSLVFLVVAAYASYLGTIDSIGTQPGAVPYITLEYVFVSLVIGFIGMAIYEIRWMIVEAGLLNRGGVDD